MKKPGPPPKPTVLKVLHGSHETGLRARAQREIKPRKVTPSCPAWLSPEAKQVWRALAPELIRLGTLTVVDGLALTSLCIAAANLRHAHERMMRRGRTQAVMQGRIWVRVPRPEVAMERQAILLLDRLGQEFGLSPGARARLSGVGAGQTAVTGIDVTLGGLLDYD